MSQKPTLPGDKVAIIEEFETGANTFDDGQSIRSLVIGVTEFEKANRVAKINEIKKPGVPKPGDVIIGNVSALMNNMFAINILYINEKPNHSSLECICQQRREKIINQIWKQRFYKIHFQLRTCSKYRSKENMVRIVSLPLLVFSKNILKPFLIPRSMKF